mgnify:CR=1 FL=1
MVRLVLLFIFVIFFSTKAFAPIFIENKSFESAEEVVAEGLELFTTKNYSQSQEYFQKFLAEDPNNEFAPRAQFYYAMTYFYLRDWKGAENQFNEFLNNYSEQEIYPDFLYFFAKTLHLLNKRQQFKCEMVNLLIQNYAKDPFTTLDLVKDNYFGCKEKTEEKKELGKIILGKKEEPKVDTNKEKPKKQPERFVYEEGVIVPIAVTDFSSSSIGKNMSSVVSDNLIRSGVFNSLDNKSFIQSESSLANQPRFDDWKIINAKFLVSGKVTEESNKVSIEFRLYNVDEQRQIIGKKYETSKSNWRRVSHIISDSIYAAITNNGGMFDTRIVYVAETGPKDNQQRRLAIMDQDQANHRYLTDGSYLVATPSFSPNSQKITYVGYIERKTPRVYVFDLETGQQEQVGEFPGITFAPRFSPDGSKIIMSYSDPDVGNTEVYTLDLVTRITKRITNSSGIDIAGSFSPDGDQIVFNSDRTGRRHIYLVNSNGGNPKRISREEGSYYDPIWSPLGDKIAFTKQQGGNYYIGVMDIDGSNERMIAKAYHVEGARWSSNGKQLIYYKTERTSSDGSGGDSSLYAIDLSGYNERKLITPLGAIQPDWSLLMH